jgi:beta-glucuronidase
VVGKPENRVLIREGQAARYLLGGRWYFRQDDNFVGDSQRFFERRSLNGWTAITVPHNWNAQDTTENRSSVGWYRKEFRVPRPPGGRRWTWRVRFEGANHRVVVYLNGRKIGGHVGGYFPFEVDLENLRRGRNTLVVKVSSLRSRTDPTHWRAAAYNGYGSGGWWNFGGLLREVYLRRIDAVDVEDVRVLPSIRCVRCPARVEARIRLRNATGRNRNVRYALNLRGPGGAGSQRIAPRPAGVAARGHRELVARFTIPRPRLWQPGRPRLYSLTVAAGLGGRRLSSYRLAFGVRHWARSRGGGFLLNGRRLNVRGASLHEDHPVTGGALSPGQRAELVSRLRQLGATVTRAHYPLHPALLEAFDRRGILYWSQAPIYQVPNSFLNSPSFRRVALDLNRRTVLHNANHASLFVWSIGNELAGSRGEAGHVGSGFARFVREAKREVKALDPTRPVAIDRQSRIGEPIFHPALAQLDVLGVNEYFGWYDSYSLAKPREPARIEELGPFLDQVHRTYPRTPLFITEYGAEGSRSGPVDQKGTLEFQTEFMRRHHAIHASKRYINGSIAWALKDFRVEPGWLGGAPREWATPPWHNKSLIDESGSPKPVFDLMRRLWRRTRQLR